MDTPKSIDTDINAQFLELITCISWRLKKKSIKEFSSFKLTFAQARVVFILAGKKEPIPMTDIATLLEITPRSATSLIDGLSVLGLIERKPDPADRRSVLVVLSDEGGRIHTKMKQVRLNIVEAVIKDLSKEQKIQLLELLGTIHESEVLPLHSKEEIL